MKVGDEVRHIPLPNGSTLGHGIVRGVETSVRTNNHQSVLVEFYEYDGELSVRWMRPETLEVVPRVSEATIGNWLFAHFLFLPFVWVMDKLGIRP